MRKSLYVLSLITLMCSTLWVMPLDAQERSGWITGSVADAAGGILPGARVEWQPQGSSAVTNGQGQFTISGVAPGQYKLSVNYVGFAPFSTDVTVAAGQTARVDAVLQIGLQSEVVTVRGDRQHGEVEAINIERTADNIIQVLPNEVITSLPNTNIADAVGRLPSVSLERDEGEGKYIQIRGTEPRLSNVTIDGIHVPSPEGVRNVKLDAIPADLVDMVEINKTLSANQDADAIGGSVNLVTKSATDKPYVTVLGMGGYTPIGNGRTQYQFSGTAGSALGRTRSWDCCLAEAMTTTPAASMTSSQLTRGRRDHSSQTLWTCGIIFTIARATVLVGRLITKLETCHRYICAGFIPSSRTLASSGHTPRGSIISSLVLRIPTIRVVLQRREQLKAAAASAYRT
jgi:hypothetical protein